MKGHFKNDLWLVGALAIVLVVLVLLSALIRKEGAIVLIRRGGEVVESLPLQKDREVVVEVDGHYNRVVIQDGAVFVEEADCPHQLCVKQGKIRYQGQSIVCLPHGVVVEIIGPEVSDLDGITGGRMP